MGFFAWVGDPDIGKHLLREEGEVVVDEVRHHWVAYVRPTLETVGVVLLLAAAPFVHVNVAWFFLIAALLLALHATWCTVREVRDRFVVTNMRVFRVHGVLSTHLATMPLSRILDISDAKVSIRTRGEQTLVLDGPEFVRRFALHILPDGFRRVRHYGLLAPGARRALALARELAHYASPPRTPRVTPDPEPPPLGVAFTHRCPDCGAPVRIFVLERQELSAGWPRGPP